VKLINLYSVLDKAVHVHRINKSALSLYICVNINIIYWLNKLYLHTEFITRLLWFDLRTLYFGNGINLAAFSSHLFVIKRRRDESHAINSSRDCRLSVAHDYRVAAKCRLQFAQRYHHAADNTANKVSLKYASAQQLERSIFIVRSRHRIGNFEQNMPRTNNTPLHWTAG